MPGKTVLVVEDQLAIATLLRRLVERCGAQADVAYDGEQALARMRRRRPDLILLDLKMPLMSGQELLEVMAGDASLSDIPVVVVSTDENAAAYVSRGTPVITKPFAPADVEHIVREVLSLG